MVQCKNSQYPLIVEEENRKCLSNGFCKADYQIILSPLNSLTYSDLLQKADVHANLSNDQDKCALTSGNGLLPAWWLKATTEFLSGTLEKEILTALDD